MKLADLRINTEQSEHIGRAQPLNILVDEYKRIRITLIFLWKRWIKNDFTLELIFGS